MPEDKDRKDALSARAPSGEHGFAPAPQDHDPGSEPTISSARINTGYTQPTRVDPDAPIHRGVPGTGPERPTTRNHVALPAGYELQEYTFEALLGTGGFGLTYLARDNNLQCQVAIKEYLPNDLAVRTAGQTVCPRTESDTHGYRIGLDGFLAESRVLASFRHPNIVRVTRFFEANGTAYMVMDYERGEPLRDWLKENGPLDEEQLLAMFLPLLDGLEVVHRASVLHRDIKPANIYVREEDGSLVLLDFGAARYARSGDSRSLTSIVTPGFAPFEQYHTHGAQGPWSDLYAFGGVLYWVVTGEKPLEAPSRMRSDIMPLALSLGRGRYSEHLLRAIDWALMPDETERPKSVSQLRTVLTGEAAVPMPVPAKADIPAAAPASLKKPLLMAGAGLITIAIGAGAFWPKPQTSLPVTEPQPLPVAATPPAAESVESPKPAPAKPARAAKKSGKENAQDPAPLAEAQDKSKEKTGKAEKSAAPAPTASVILTVTPEGRIVLDGKPLGNSPPLTRLTVSAGVRHRLEIHSNGPHPTHYWTVELEPNETREIRADFQSRQ